MQISAAAVEFIGTFIVVFIIGATEDVFVIGLVLALLVLFFGKISGGYFNPGATLVMLYKGSLSLSDAVIYISVQIIAGIMAIELWRYIKGDSRPFYWARL